MTLSRTLLSVGLVWGTLWAALAIIAGTIIGIVDPGQIDPGEEPIVLAPGIGLAGFICGVLFGALLSGAERGKPIVDAPVIRIVMCGALVSAAVPLLTGKGIPELFIIVPLGVVSAIASVAIVRKWRALAMTY
jgi:hypothetical protein